MEDWYSYIRATIIGPVGYALDWRMVGGCQYKSLRFAELLECPYHEAVWQCEMIGPHTRHHWSDHLVEHERMGNGWSCRSIDKGVRFSFHSV